ncbi:hypothetical protein E1162_01155 [Rhodobacteraceae bacterium RKSG542]|uniref:FeoC-like transcriptional regulator n=1 Tax=Pseudovibrio flavus TaxID=2529854 RepID=UPI0012BCD56B|nr:FeoC-like transcriptional regulator [Pseudovibrio flavus]MTI15842.1 hypothetical protein [Pseudovibrio flavus]
MLIDILKLVEENGQATPQSVAMTLNVSSEFAAQMLKTLEAHGKITAFRCGGCTGCAIANGPIYMPASAQEQPQPTTGCKSSSAFKL